MVCCFSWQHIELQAQFDAMRSARPLEGLEDKDDRLPQAGQTTGAMMHVRSEPNIRDRVV
jgi:hypothetical protein